MATELTWQRAIQKVLGSSPTPLHYNEITERIIAEGYRKSIGATPSATVNAQIASSIKHDGESSPYIRVSKGVFALRGGSVGAVVIPKLTLRWSPKVGQDGSLIQNPKYDPHVQETTSA